MKIFQRGFTLAELLIVIVILGILGGIALPRFFPQAEKARAAEAVAMLSAIRQGEMAHRLENGVFLALTADVTGTSVAEWAQIGLDQPPNNATATTGPYFTYSVDAATGLATATRTLRGGIQTGNTINLDSTTGTWTGSHINVPSN